MDGNLDPEHTPPIGYALLTSVAEFRELLTSHFEELALIAAESFAAPSRDLLRLDFEVQKANPVKGGVTTPNRHPPSAFVYQPEANRYVGPEGKLLRPQGRHNNKKRGLEEVPLRMALSRGNLPLES